MLPQSGLRGCRRGSRSRPRTGTRLRTGPGSSSRARRNRSPRTIGCTRHSARGRAVDRRSSQHCAPVSHVAALTHVSLQTPVPQRRPAAHSASLWQRAQLCDGRQTPLVHCALLAQPVPASGARAPASAAPESSPQRLNRVCPDRRNPPQRALERTMLTRSEVCVHQAREGHANWSVDAAPRRVPLQP